MTIRIRIILVIFALLAGQLLSCSSGSSTGFDPAAAQKLQQSLTRSVRIPASRGP